MDFIKKNFPVYVNQSEYQYLFISCKEDQRFQDQGQMWTEEINED